MAENWTHPATDTYLTISDRNHGAYLWITVLLCAVFSTIALCTRLGIRWKQYAADDWTVLAAQIIAWVSYAAAITALANGLGKSTNMVQQDQARRQAHSLRCTQALVLVSLALSESSIILLIQRVFTMNFNGSGLITIGMHILNAMWLISSVTGICVRCTPEYIFDNAGGVSCHGDVYRWDAIYSTSCVLAAAAAFFPLVFIAFVQSMTLKHKLIASFAFLCRLPLIPLAILYMIYYTSWSKKMADVETREPGFQPGPALVLPLVLQQCHLAWSLMSASIPCMRSFLRAFGKTNAIPGYEQRLAERYHITKHPELKLEDQTSPASQYQSQTMRSGPASSRRSSEISRAQSAVSEKRPPQTPVNVIMNDPSPGGMRLRPEQLESKTVIYHSDSPPQSQPRSRLRTGSGPSTEKFIMRETRWEVRHSPYHAS